jgi:hypothetical protein
MIACEHGSLKRQCRVCELEARLTECRALFGPLPGDPEWETDAQWTDLGWTRNQFAMAKAAQTAAEVELLRLREGMRGLREDCNVVAGRNAENSSLARVVVTRCDRLLAGPVEEVKP